MSTLLPVRRCRKSEIGVTVVELVVVLIIVGLMAILISAPLQMTNQLSKNSLDRLTEAADSNLSIRMFSQQFAGSQIVRSDFFACTGNSKALKNESSTALSIILEPNVNPSAAHGAFSLPFASASVLGSVDNAASNIVNVSDKTVFTEGDLVILVSADDSSKVGLMKVTNIGNTGARLQLEDAAINESELQCQINPGFITRLAEFKQMSADRGLKNVFVQRFHIAHYTVNDDSISVRIFPQMPAGKPGTMFAAHFNKFQIDVQWQKRQAVGASAGANDNNETEGTLWATLNFKTYEVDTRSQGVACTEADNNATTLCINKTKYNLKEFKHSTRFVMSGTRRLNPKVTTNAIPKTDLFPTCYVKAEVAGFSLVLPPSLKGFQSGPGYRLYRIQGAVSEKGMSQISLAIDSKKQPGAKMTCINTAELALIDDDSNPRRPKDPKDRPKPNKWIPPGDIKVYDSSFALRGTSSTLDEMLCSIKGKVELLGNLSYFDPGRRRMASIKCADSVTVK